MHDADEASAFDETVRLDPELTKVVREMNELTAAVAVVSSVPVAPRAGEMDRLRARLGFSGHRRSHWLAWSGWAAAAVLALLLVIQQQPVRSRPPVAVQSPEPQMVPGIVANEMPVPKVAPSEHPAALPVNPAGLAGNEGGPVRVETKRLIQEIEVLRGQLANFQKRDRERFSPVPGVAWPIVMTMRPPGSMAEGDPSASSLNTVLGDALAGHETLIGGKLSTPDQGPDLPSDEPPVADDIVPVPTAIPIYDSARDAGTLVVGNLPPLGENETYNLWVRTTDAVSPVHVGRLPAAFAAGADALDFSLGSIGIVPSGFILTKDADGTIASPGSGNTILLGP
jgi:hypothetical protein